MSFERKLTKNSQAAGETTEISLWVKTTYNRKVLTALHKLVLKNLQDTFGDVGLTRIEEITEVSTSGPLRTLKCTFRVFSSTPVQVVETIED